MDWVAGDGADIFTCLPGSTGDNTSCTFSLFWDGSANGFAGEVLNGFFLAPYGLKRHTIADKPKRLCSR